MSRTESDNRSSGTGEPFSPVVAHGPVPVAAAGVVPASRAERDAWRNRVQAYLAEQRLTPPLTLDELTQHSIAVAGRGGADASLHGFLTVMLSNELWRDTLAAVPYERRILMLPQCLRTRTSCPATVDEWGVLCEQCGRCPTGHLQEEAESLGYVVLVAEGTTVVTRLLEQGKVDAVIGVSCLPVLERAFPFMAAEAVPGIAIPLTRDGCDTTAADMDWVLEALHLRRQDALFTPLNLTGLRQEVDSWFAVSPLHVLLRPEGSATEAAALAWLTKSGKRWRPLLTACAYQALRSSGTGFPVTVRKLALAVECFHKASLAHDDIEDDEDSRYGEATLHRRYGVPVALNVGDLLVGEGYRLIAACGAAEADTLRMLTAAAEGHRTLALGQGDELFWRREPLPLPPAAVLDMFRRKTAPAFDVALSLGVLAAGGDAALCGVLKSFSDALGVAYQIQDDLDGFGVGKQAGLAERSRPSLLFSLAWENAGPERRAPLQAAWQTADRDAATGEELGRLIAATGAVGRARDLLETYRQKTFGALNPLTNVELKRLLYRVTSRILRAADSAVSADEAGHGERS